MPIDSLEEMESRLEVLYHEQVKWAGTGYGIPQELIEMIEILEDELWDEISTSVLIRQMEVADA